MKILFEANIKMLKLFQRTFEIMNMCVKFNKVSTEIVNIQQNNNKL